MRKTTLPKGKTFCPESYEASEVEEGLFRLCMVSPIRDSIERIILGEGGDISHGICPNSEHRDIYRVWMLEE